MKGKVVVRNQLLSRGIGGMVNNNNNNNKIVYCHHPFVHGLYTMIFTMRHTSYIAHNYTVINVHPVFILGHWNINYW